jgi:hypothetical protein
MSAARWQHSRGLAALTLLCLPALVWAQSEPEAEVREEALLRCYYEMGEFGIDAVNLCVEAEVAAARTLAPQLAEPLVARCIAQSRHRGWVMAALCAERDRAAEAALAAYPPEHAALIEACREQAGRRGANEVRACVELRLANPPGRPQ